jgi:hypothetical protein
MMRFVRSALAAFLSVVLTQSGCATLQSADRRASDLSTYFAKTPFAQSCDAIWPAALRVAEARGFPLSGSDRKLLGGAPEGIMGQLVSAGTQTYRTKDGGLETGTDWNRESGTRLRLTCTPAGPQECRVRYDVIGGGVATSEERELGPDWNFDLDLLRAAEPGKAAALEASLGG